jgi:clan AA aspartic protease (TIGR02281 family)
MKPPMMSRMFAWCGVASIAALGALAAPGAEPSAAEATLKEKDLKRSGQTYVLPAENEVRVKLAAAQGLYKQLSLAIAQQRAFAQGVSDSKAMVQELMQQRMMLNQQLSQAATAVQHNQIVGALNVLNDQINMLRQNANDPEAASKVAAQVPRQREAFIQAVIDLRQIVDEATTRYQELADDEEVKKALEALNRTAKVKVALGPSRAFLANAGLLKKVESAVLSETIDLRKEGGVFWLDVTFNGKVTRPLVFDTGAASVVLPYELASELGLKPGPDDPIVKAHVADGSVVEARQMTIPSVRVGKFTIKDVVGIVMPAEKRDVPPLLGGTFHKFFSYKFSPESGKLILSKVETPDEAAPLPKAKTSRSTKARR